jgi:DNA polymerase I-like protein with 3'-5' exonuclease and polymerase domains
MKLITEVAEKRGWIKSLSGRRSRFKKGDKFYSAFAKLLQMSEADMVKSKLRQLYRDRKLLNYIPRCPVHDELVGGIAKGDQYRKRYEEACAEVNIKLRVPMIWNSGYGRNWKDCK